MNNVKNLKLRLSDDLFLRNKSPSYFNLKKSLNIRLNQIKAHKKTKLNELEVGLIDINSMVCINEDEDKYITIPPK